MKRYYSNTAKDNSEFYVGSAIYQTDTTVGNPTLSQLKYIMTDEGRLSQQKDGYFAQEYMLKDHLGNTRVLFCDYNGNDSIKASEVLQQAHYYPFGLVFMGLDLDADTNRFLYNGKELQTDGGLGWYDYGARMYDASLGRWHVIDPLSEKYYTLSPYNYCANNPILFKDIEGKYIVIHYQSGNADRVYIYKGGNQNIPNNSFVKSVVSAYNYNVQNGGGKYMKYAAKSSSIHVNIYNEEFSSEHSKGKIYWNPKYGLKTDENKVLSPATVLEHEVAHGVGYKKDAMGFKERQKEKSTNYGNKEEERVIKGTEQETAKANGEINEGEVTRKNHKGGGVITQGTNSNKVDEAATKKYKERLERYNNYVE